MSVQKKRYTSRLYRDRTGSKPTPNLLDLRKSQLDIHSRITGAIKTSPKTIPEIAKDVGMDARSVLWYLSTYLKYNEIAVVGKNEDGYYSYSLKEK